MGLVLYQQPDLKVLSDNKNISIVAKFEVAALNYNEVLLLNNALEKWLKIYKDNK